MRSTVIKQVYLMILAGLFYISAGLLWMGNTSQSSIWWITKDHRLNYALISKLQISHTEFKPGEITAASVSPVDKAGDQPRLVLHNRLIEYQFADLHQAAARLPALVAGIQAVLQGKQTYSYHLDPFDFLFWLLLILASISLLLSIGFYFGHRPRSAKTAAHAPGSPL